MSNNLICFFKGHNYNFNLTKIDTGETDIVDMVEWSCKCVRCGKRYFKIQNSMPNSSKYEIKPNIKMRNLIDDLIKKYK